MRLGKNPEPHLRRLRGFELCAAPRERAAAHELGTVCRVLHFLRSLPPPLSLLRSCVRWCGKSVPTNNSFEGEGNSSNRSESGCTFVSCINSIGPALLGPFSTALSSSAKTPSWPKALQSPETAGTTEGHRSC